MLVALNLLLAGGGIALIHGYLNKRDRGAQAASLRSTAKDKMTAPNEVEPKAGDEGRGKAKPTEPATATDKKQNATLAGDGSATPATVRGDENAPTPAPAEPDTQTAGPKTPDPKPDPKPDPMPDPKPDPKVPSPKTKPPDPKTKPPPKPPPGPPDAGPFASPPPNEAEEAERVRTLHAKIRLVVSRHQSQLNRCYESAAKVTNPSDPLQGRIIVQFAVHPDGFARSIGVVSNDTGSAALGKCIVGSVGSWTFPSSGGDALEFAWPFDFQAR